MLLFSFLNSKQFSPKDLIDLCRLKFLLRPENHLHHRLPARPSLKYASEGIKATCSWAYKGVGNDFVHGDDYFLSPLPIVNWRLAQVSSLCVDQGRDQGNNCLE
ncbi:unnamed protein product [Lactuca saligna]|uniref:Uncharacterized protein n=1 Tax=Lactuca saligna TaxID=75948 RepID=A0AA35YXH6_LACSI|nr:unnamed protein product [Lactuca saligna]